MAELQQLYQKNVEGAFTNATREEELHELDAMQQYVTSALQNVIDNALIQWKLCIP